MEPIISIEKLSLRYDQDGQKITILKDLTLNIMPGEFLCLVGPSGVGKSTLLRVLMDLVPPSSGSVTIRECGSQLANMALVFQEPRLLPWRRIAANAAFGLERLGLTPREREKRVAEALRFFGVAALARRFPHQRPAPACCVGAGARR